MSTKTMSAVVRHLKARIPHAVQALQGALAGHTRGAGLLDLEPPQEVLDEALGAVLLAALVPDNFNPTISTRQREPNRSLAHEENP